MGAVQGSMNYVLDKLRETASVMGAEKWINYVLEKSKEFLAVLQPFGKICIAKVDEVFPQLEHFGKICIAKVGEVFPPEITAEQMKYWAQVATPYIIGAVVILILLRFFRGGGGGSKAKMMIAPGTGRASKIPRPSFEASPRSYFRDLRGK
ncbi:hypothetical protein RHMOL_Rhmol09G0178100 [Rhododendron molle]|uniref:Uncharacterized protein n=1 Tax=Rhododendron molle TaxID=49168 RepID=A0ACC0MEH2_RHOML|nr:hypothetical protein RHMOL_Rhmol09G0178100 [Rhododendron molle]